MPLNSKQRESIAKYAYDVSKGFLLAGVMGTFTNKLSVLAFIGHLIIAFYTLVFALMMEREMSDYKSVFWVIFALSTVAFFAFLFSQWRREHKH